MDYQNLYSVAQIRALENAAIEQYQINAFELMKSAGKAAFDYLVLNWPNANTIEVICGQGNNGGDGYVLAYQAKRGDLDVRLHYLGDLAKLPPCAQQAKSLCDDIGLVAKPFEAHTLNQADLIVDALLGIGINDVVRPDYDHAITSINRHSAPVLAIDVPSGLNADTGSILGSAIKATKTITFIGLKQGFFTNDGFDQCGEVHLATLDIPKEIYEAVVTPVRLLNSHLLKSMPVRKKNAQKGNFGHVLVVGGDQGMAGAACLAAEGALRVGAGLVSVATHPGNAAIINAHYPEIMCHEISDPLELQSLLARATVVIVGPGLGQRPWGRALLDQVLAANLPTVIDADALNLLGTLSTCQAHWVLTPHPGEAARLLGLKSAGAIQSDRFQAVKQLASNGGIWVLKGAGTLIHELGGAIEVCPYGNPGMASGGMGDALTGIIAGILAQHVPLKTGVAMAVLLHSLAADQVGKTGQRGMVASDVIDQLRRTLNLYS